MTESYYLSGLFLKLYSNKNFNTFKSGANLLKGNKDIDNLNQPYGFLYDDFDPSDDIKTRWTKEYPGIKIFTVARRRKTVKMDSKIAFAKKMMTSSFTPDTFSNCKDLSTLECNDDDLLYIKKDGSTSSRHVFVTKYSKINEMISNLHDVRDYIIQKSMQNPDLYEGKRYKIRVHVILHDKNVYLHRKCFATVSKIKYDPTTDDNNTIREMNVIYQANTEKFILFNELDDYEKIENCIINALHDFKKYYQEEINTIDENEFSILGFDFVVDRDKNVNIIEINHRSN